MKGARLWVGSLMEVYNRRQSGWDIHRQLRRILRNNRSPPDGCAGCRVTIKFQLAYCMHSYHKLSLGAAIKPP